ncbi:MAG: glutamine--scyllo-inositol transaminase [Parcubacteria group bacterium Gr01-1014_31]|nr:MAG: glutamine--scyllo-inositol transaminase [Parcubacteria group bacterium Gr01-1014_31]
MATVQKFEDLLCWQKCRALVNFIFDLTDAPVFRDVDLKRQMRRAAVSTMSNIAEGFDRGTQAEFIDALYIAKGEAGEVRSQLYIARDRRYIEMSKLREGLGLTDECSRLIQSFAEKVKGGAHRGMQFKQVKRVNPLDDLLKQHAPDVYRRLHPDAK